MLDTHQHDIALTPKGEAYAMAHQLAGSRKEIEAEIERLIAILDAMDGDPEAEDDGTSEPTLGAAEPFVQHGTMWGPHWDRPLVDCCLPLGSQATWAEGDRQDGEAEDVCEDEGAEHDGWEPALGWAEAESCLGLYGHGVDDEQEEDDPAGGDVLDEPHDTPDQDLEVDEPYWPYLNGAHLPGGGSGI